MDVIMAADDFGFSEASSLGALRACKDGLSTVAGLMANMEAAPFAVALQKKYLPQLGLVLHTNFVQGRPCSNPADIPSLVDETGAFRRSGLYKSGTFKIGFEDAKRETLAQMERFRELTGAYPIHVEGHSFFDESTTQAMFEAAQVHGAHFMEMPGVPAQPKFKHIHENLNYDYIIDRGSLPEDFLEDRFGLLEGPQDEVRVLHLHPGYLDQYVLDNTTLTLPRCRDLATMLDPQVRAWFDKHDIHLVDYRAVFDA